MKIQILIHIRISVYVKRVMDRVCILENIQRIFFLTFWYLHFSVFNNEACTSCTFKVQMQTTFCC